MHPALPMILLSTVLAAFQYLERINWWQWFVVHSHWISRLITSRSHQGHHPTQRKIITSIEKCAPFVGGPVWLVSMTMGTHNAPQHWHFLRIESSCRLSFPPLSLISKISVTIFQRATHSDGAALLKATIFGSSQSSGGLATDVYVVDLESKIRRTKPMPQKGPALHRSWCRLLYARHVHKSLFLLLPVPRCSRSLPRNALAASWRAPHWLAWITLKMRR